MQLTTILLGAITHFAAGEELSRDHRILRSLQIADGKLVVLAVPKDIPTDSKLRDDYVILLCHKLLQAGRAIEANDVLTREASGFAADATLDVEFFLPRPAFSRTERLEDTSPRGHYPEHVDWTRWQWVIFDEFSAFYATHPVSSDEYVRLLRAQCALRSGDAARAKEVLAGLAERRSLLDTQLKEADQAFLKRLGEILAAEAERRRNQNYQVFSPLLGYTLPLWIGGPEASLPPIFRPWREALLTEADVALLEGARRTAFLRFGDYLAYGALVPAERRVQIGRRRWSLARELGDEAAAATSAKELGNTCEAIVKRLGQKGWCFTDFDKFTADRDDICRALIPKLLGTCESYLEELKK